MQLRKDVKRRQNYFQQSTVFIPDFSGENQNRIKKVPKNQISNYMQNSLSHNFGHKDSLTQHISPFIDQRKSAENLSMNFAQNLF